MSQLKSVLGNCDRSSHYLSPLLLGLSSRVVLANFLFFCPKSKIIGTDNYYRTFRCFSCGGFRVHNYEWCNYALAQDFYTNFTPILTLILLKNTQKKVGDKILSLYEQPQNPCCHAVLVDWWSMAGGGIEPPTRGFSVLCSTN